MRTQQIERYFFFGLFLATFIFVFLIFRPFWIIIVLSIAFSVALFPIFNWLTKSHFPRWLASLLTVVLFTVLLLGPIAGIGVLVFNQSQDVYTSIVSGEGIGPVVDSITETINRILPDGINFDLEQKARDFMTLLSGNIEKIFSATLSAFFSLTVIWIAMYYFLKDGPKWKKEIMHLSPLSDADDNKIITRIQEAINGVILGHLLIAVVQGFAMGFGLWLFGVPNFALWGVVTAIASLVPILGTGLVAVPALIYLLIAGSLFNLIGFAIWALLIVGLIDNLLHPLVIAGRIRIPPIFILFAVLGGISFLGPIGVLVGPLALAILYTLTHIYKTEFQNKTSEK